MRCLGNCATCEVASESKAACCAIQTLKNIIEIKAMLAEMRISRDPFEGVPDVESDDEQIEIEEIESEPTVLGTEKESTKRATKKVRR